MKASAVRPASKWATFRAAWQASGGPRGRYIDPTLYSDERLAKWLPLKFSTAMPALLWFLMLYDLFFMIVGLQGTVAAWWSPGQGVYVPPLLPGPPISNAMQESVLLAVFMCVYRALLSLLLRSVLAHVKIPIPNKSYADSLPRCLQICSCSFLGCVWIFISGGGTTFVQSGSSLPLALPCSFCSLLRAIGVSRIKYRA